MRTFWFAFFIFSTLNFSVAQSGIPEPATCGTIDTDSTPDLGALGECFDIGSIFDTINNECITLYLRMNVHFFLDDNCQGSIDPLYYQFRTDDNGNQVRIGQFIPATDAQKTAELLINRSNAQLANNYPQWNQTEWGVPYNATRYCVPIRYVLAGVYVHCSTVSRSTSGHNLNHFHSTYRANSDSEINVYIVNLSGSDNGAAFLGSPYFTSETLGVDFGGTDNVFNHEMGHVLRLDHSFNFDGIDDTPRIIYDYDNNCDGILDEFSSRCWTIFTDTDLHPTPPLITFPGSTQPENPCAREAPCLSHPCCEWKYANNNMMHYSGYAGSVPALTRGQILKMLTTLNSEAFCPYIAQIGGECAPPMANVNIFPNEETEQDCKYCITFEGSMNDQEHLIEFFDATTGSLFHTTGWVNTSANKYCISKKLTLNMDIYNNGFQAGHTYKVRLTIKNACGTEASEELEFTLPDIGCAYTPGPGIGLTRLSPNPFTNQVSFDYEVLDQGSLQIMLQHTILPQTRIEILPMSDVLPAGLETLSLNTYDLPSGVYALIFKYNDYTQSFTLVK